MDLTTLSPLPNIEDANDEEAAIPRFNSTVDAPHEDNNSSLSNETDSPSVSLVALAAQLHNYKMGFALHTYWLPAIILVGLIGNSLSFLIMMKPHNRRIGCYNYMAALSVSDTMMLVNALTYWTTAFPTRPLYYTECNIMAWFFQAISFAYMTFILSMTVDRFLAIRYPFKARTLCSAYRARVAIACISVFSLLYTLPYLFTSGLIYKTRSCLAVLTKHKLSTIYNWVNIFLGSIIPFSGLLTMNGLIIFTIKRRGKYLQTKQPNSQDQQGKSGQHNPGFEAEQETEMGDNPSSKSSVAISMTKTSISTSKSSKSNKSTKESSSSQSSRDNQLTIMLLLVTFTFLLLTLPQYARYLVAILWNYTASPQDYANYFLIAHVTNKMFYLNSACNFFLYCLSGTKFRQDLISLFMQKK